MSKSVKNLIVLLLVGIVFWVFFFSEKEPPVEYGAGVHAPELPVQNSATKQAFSFKSYSITPLADFEITAKVLSKKRYKHGRESELSPVDLALGWGAYVR